MNHKYILIDMTGMRRMRFNVTQESVNERNDAPYLYVAFRL
jgi:hypothetical protein